MMLINIEAGQGQVDDEIRRAIAVLRDADISVRKRSRSLKMRGVVQVKAEQGEQALALLAAANIRASVLPR